MKNPYSVILRSYCDTTAKKSKKQPRKSSRDNVETRIKLHFSFNFFFVSSINWIKDFLLHALNKMFVKFDKQSSNSWRAVLHSNSRVSYGELFCM